MSDEIWNTERVKGVGYVVCAGHGGMIFSHGQWKILGGPEMNPGDIIPIRPLRIEVVKEKV